MEVWRDTSKPFFEIKRKVAASHLRPVESWSYFWLCCGSSLFLGMVGDAHSNAHPVPALENALPRHPAAPTPFPMQGLTTDGVHEVQRALFTCKVSVLESPQLHGGAAIRKTWTSSFGYLDCGSILPLFRASPRKGASLCHRLDVNVAHILGLSGSP